MLRYCMIQTHFLFVWIINSKSIENMLKDHIASNARLHAVAEEYQMQYMQQYIQAFFRRRVFANQPQSQKADGTTHL